MEILNLLVSGLDKFWQQSTIFTVTADTDYLNLLMEYWDGSDQAQRCGLCNLWYEIILNVNISRSSEESLYCYNAMRSNHNVNVEKK